MSVHEKRELLINSLQTLTGFTGLGDIPSAASLKISKFVKTGGAVAALEDCWLGLLRVRIHQRCCKLRRALISALTLRSRISPETLNGVSDEQLLAFVAIFDTLPPNDTVGVLSGLGLFNESTLASMSPSEMREALIGFLESRGLSRGILEELTAAHLVRLAQLDISHIAVPTSLDEALSDGLYVMFTPAELAQMSPTQKRDALISEVFKRSGIPLSVLKQMTDAELLIIAAAYSRTCPSSVTEAIGGQGFNLFSST